MDQERLYAAVAECLQLPRGKVSDELSRQNTPEWDSLNHLLIITAIEAEFDVRFTMDEIASMQSVADFRGVIEGRRDAGASG
jgi:acyl carrier protein